MQDSDDVTWDQVASTLIAWRRFLLQGAVAVWVVALGLGLALPRWYRCEALISLPDLPGFAVGEGAASPLTDFKRRIVAERPAAAPGVPAGTFKLIVAGLADGSVLGSAFAELLAPAELRLLRKRIADVFQPVTAGTQKHIDRLETNETVLAVAIQYESTDETKSLRVVQKAIALTRGVVEVHWTGSHIRALQKAAELDVSRAHEQLASLRLVNASLATLARDLVRIGTEVPAATDAPRQVVATADGGYRYLPASAQLVGVRATIAGNEHTARLLEGDLVNRKVALTVWARLDAAIRADQEASRLPDVRLHLQEARAGLQGASGNANDVQTVLDSISSELASISNQTVTVKSPTMTSRSQLALAAAVAGGLTALLLFVPFVVGFWRRLRPLEATD